MSRWRGSPQKYGPLPASLAYASAGRA